jgi:hypothetical protein
MQIGLQYGSEIFFRKIRIAARWPLELVDVGLVIFDEFHERNLDSDLCLALALYGRGSHYGGREPGAGEELRESLVAAKLNPASVRFLLEKRQRQARHGLRRQFHASPGRRKLQCRVERDTPARRRRPTETIPSQRRRGCQATLFRGLLCQALRRKS